MIEPAYNLQEQRQQLVEKQNKLQKEYFELHSSGKLSVEKKTKLESELKTIDRAIKKIDKSATTGTAPDLFDYLNQARKKAEQLRALHKEFFEAYQREKIKKPDRKS